MNQAILKRLIIYHPSTGLFFWVGRNGNLAGSTTNKGYISITILGKRYMAHRLAFLYVNGYMPEYDIDHINGNKTDNSIGNLRHVSRSCNLQNRSISKANTSGYTGVTKSQGKWKATIMIQRKVVSLGSHLDPISAALSRIELEERCHKLTCDHNNHNRIKLRNLGYKV